MPVVSEARAGLTHTRVEAEVADQLLRGREASDIADQATKVAAVMRSTPGTVSSRRISGERTARAAISRSSSAICWSKRSI
jgi:hypothetical protein